MEGSHIPFESRAAPVKEQNIQGISPLETACLRAKAKALASLEEETLCLGCDQTLSFEGGSFSKAQSLQEAEEQLSKLQGKTHHLHSAYALAVLLEGKPLLLKLAARSLPMAMKAMDSGARGAYLATQEWQGSLGAYRIEGKGAQLFPPFSLENREIIMGLPLRELLFFLKSLGIHPAIKAPWSLSFA